MPIYINFDSGNDSSYTATMYFSCIILANTEVEPHAPIS